MAVLVPLTPILLLLAIWSTCNNHFLWFCFTLLSNLHDRLALTVIHLNMFTYMYSLHQLLVFDLNCDWFIGLCHVWLYRVIKVLWHTVEHCLISDPIYIQVISVWSTNLDKVFGNTLCSFYSEREPLGLCLLCNLWVWFWKNSCYLFFVPVFCLPAVMLPVFV